MVKFGRKELTKHEVRVGKKKEIKDNQKNKELINWLQGLGQRVESLEKRLDAVERRLSEKPFEGTKFNSKSIVMEKDYEEKWKEIKTKLENKITNLKKELETLKGRKIESKNETPVTISIRKGEGINVAREIANIERRLEKIEKKKATPTVRVGKIEVPIEITGIIGGFLAFIIAILLFGGHKDIVVSPPFVMFIGIVLLTATALKTYLINISKK